jgi:hypothetical protein
MSKDTTQINFNKNWWLRHDLNTFSGRIRHWFVVSDPMKSFTSDEQLKQMQKDLLAAEKRAENGVGTFSKAEAEALYNKKMITLSGIHPDSGEVVPWFARTSAFVPTNLPIIGAMMLAAPTPFNTIFWQWVN